MKDGGPAFPCKQLDWDRAERGVERYNHFVGMSLRDYFAAAALQAVGLNATVMNPQADHIANLAYIVADAMLAERDK